MPERIGPHFKSFELVIVSSQAIGLAPELIRGLSFGLITVEGAKLRFRLDGNDPSDAVGNDLGPGDVLELNSHNQLSLVRFIRRGVIDAVLHCQYGGG